jgi:hypothetical protein
MSHHEISEISNEPSLEEIFADPMIQRIMARDGARRDLIESALIRLAKMQRDDQVMQ